MSSEEKKEWLKKIDHALESVRTHLAVDGGDVEVVDINDDKKVFIKWLGNCESCSMSAMTMKAGIEQAILQQVPEVTSIEALNGVTL
jgi:Fe-S cluster biogenesis protein NfuA